MFEIIQPPVQVPGITGLFSVATHGVLQVQVSCDQPENPPVKWYHLARHSRDQGLCEKKMLRILSLFLLKRDFHFCTF